MMESMIFEQKEFTKKVLCKMNEISTMLDVKLNLSPRSHESKHVEEEFLTNLLVCEGLKEVAMEQPIAIAVDDLNNIHAVKTIVSGDLGVKEESHVQRITIKEIKTQTSSTRISPCGKNTHDAVISYVKCLCPSKEKKKSFMNKTLKIEMENTVDSKEFRKSSKNSHI
ncbi:Dihydrolipoamide acetyltransferase component of pyruvate dehydrogenase complex [Forsythia ovata]|uniref:Dihydrolipoamide acetyltransferase component of pyruvate dehydrogenase complex n=1 Tax=Forsythia ovata TaxID=205694 RepID=A0ABD1Q042_9LAMI